MILILILFIIIILLIIIYCCKKDNFKDKYPIDIVYTWGGENMNQTNIRTAYNNELKFSLRSVFKNMPWFNKIYIVINTPLEKNKPSWFNNLYHDRIILLDQKSIFPKSEHHKLPCQNAEIIETYINNIPNLSEHFIYMNDDFFINKKLTPDYFYSSDGKIYLNKTVLKHKKINFNNILNLNKYPYHNIKCVGHPHVPYAFTKTSYQHFLNEYNEYISWIRNLSFQKRLHLEECQNYGMNKPCSNFHYPYRIFLLKNNLGIVSNNLYETYIDGSNKITMFLTKFISKFSFVPTLVVNNGISDTKEDITNFLDKKFPNKLYFEK